MNMKRIATRIAADLFTPFKESKVTRLRMSRDGQLLAFGWSESAVIDRILMHLERAAKRDKKRGGK